MTNEEHIEKVIKRTFKIIKKVYDNQQEKNGLKDAGNGSRIIFPKKRKDDTTRVSEQELRFIFVEQLNEEINKNKDWDVYYSVETPTIEEYGFTDPSKKESGNIDLVLHDSCFKRIALIEFKAKNPSRKAYQKDFVKLTKEPDDSLRYFIQILENTYKNTKENIINEKVDSNEEWGNKHVKFVCHSLSSTKPIINIEIKK